MMMLMIDDVYAACFLFHVTRIQSPGNLASFLLPTISVPDSHDVSNIIEVLLGGQSTTNRTDLGCSPGDVRRDPVSAGIRVGLFVPNGTKWCLCTTRLLVVTLRTRMLMPYIILLILFAHSLPFVRRVLHLARSFLC